MQISSSNGPEIEIIGSGPIPIPFQKMFLNTPSSNIFGEQNPRMPRVTSMEIVIGPNMNINNRNPFISRNFMKLFGPQPVEEDDDQKKESTFDKLVDKGFEALGGKITDDGGVEFNKTKFNNTIHMVENAITDGVDKVANFLNTTFEKAMDENFRSFFEDKHKDKIQNSGVQLISVKSHVKDTTEPVAKHEVPHLPVISTTEIQREIQKTVQINDNIKNSKAEINREIKKEIKNENYRELNQEIKKNVEVKPTVEYKKEVNGAFTEKKLSNNYIYYIACGVTILIILVIIAFSLKASKKEEISSTEKKFLGENLPYKSTNHNHLY